MKIKVEVEITDQCDEECPFCCISKRLTFEPDKCLLFQQELDPETLVPCEACIRAREETRYKPAQGFHRHVILYAKGWYGKSGDTIGDLKKLLAMRRLRRERT